MDGNIYVWPERQDRGDMRPYSIYLPDFSATSGGIRALWGMFGALLLKGQIIQPNVIYQDKDFVAIYPETITGNPLQANHVVRWILNKPGVMSLNGIPGPTTFDPTDKLYYFSRLFGKAEDDWHYLFLPILDLHLFKDQKKKRTKTAYFFGKGEVMRTSTFIHPENAILIDRNLAQDQQALADLLNECQTLYCYDPVSAMTEISRLCGTRVVMVNLTYSKEEFKLYEPGLNGISWGKDEGVPLDVKGFRSHYTQMRAEFSSKLNRFIEESQSW